MKDLKQFIGIYPVSKTLRFELRPIGRTLEWIQKNKILESDQQRADDYPKVKTLIDNYHKECIHESLHNVHLDWLPLKEAIVTHRKENTEDTKKRLEKEQESMRKKIASAIKDFRHYKELTAPTPKDLINKVFPRIYNDEALKSFNRFALYFKGFQENRNNIYSPEAISTGVPYRLVHDNFPKFLADIEVYENIKAVCPEVLGQVSTEMSPFLEGVMIDDIFRLDFYNSLLTQDGIDFFNQVIGGVSEKGKQKYRGVNEFANLYRQKHPELGNMKKALTMIPLFKQILSDRETLSYIPQQIESEQQLEDAINQFYTHITNYQRDGKTLNVLNELAKLTADIGSFTPEGIFISSKYLTDVSQRVFGHWGVINDKLTEYAIKKFGSIEKAKNKKKVESYLNKDAFSLSELCFDEDKSLSPYFSDLLDRTNLIHSNWLQYKEWCKGESKQLFLNNEDGTEIVKNLLDSIMEFLHRCEVLVVSVDNDLDNDFYNKFLPLYAELENVILLYNRVRNFITKKPSDIKKIKLNFDRPTLGDGWGLANEKKNKAILLFKDGLSYLGIMNVKGTLNFADARTDGEPTYKKMVCKNLSKPFMDFPHTFFSQKGKDTFLPSDNVLAIYTSGSFKKDSPSYTAENLYELINFYKEAINKHEEWREFGFVFSPTESYTDIGAFYNEVAKQAYKISFVEVSEQKVNDWVEKGELYLFKLHNKDYAEGAHGRKNLHTLYWENLFSSENLSNFVLKLNGQAELFYRPQSIKKSVVHKIGSKMVNRRDISGMPIPESVYRNLYLYFNGKKQEAELTEVEKSYLNQVVVKEVSHDITKDRRYTQPEFFFHVPISFNQNADGNEFINTKVLDYINNNPDVNIIGIDRGERHLIYLTLINQRGDILKQKTFNMVANFNYHAKLEQREQERDQARKSWKSVGKIKELKEGFLSAVIHEIAKMMIDNNAIVVLEDLNFGFKRGRFKVERQVYQKFEKMLIDKLNYLAFKDCRVMDDGGILRGYQLSQKFTSFQKLGKQSGFLFYIPAAYTSKIDPTSGFVNLFNFNDITNVEKRKDFFMRMNRIEMKSGEVEFEFDYRKFKTFQTDYQNVWTINTYGKRIVMQLDEMGHKKMEDFYPTCHIINAFKKKGITISDGIDIKAILSAIEANAANASFYSALFYAFQKTLQMRNSNAITEEDYILSPVAVDGRHFFSIDEANKGRDASGNWISNLPVDADANGAYHIALKGLYLLMNPLTKKIENKKWFQFMIEKPYRS